MTKFLYFNYNFISKRKIMSHFFIGQTTPPVRCRVEQLVINKITTILCQEENNLLDFRVVVFFSYRIAIQFPGYVSIEKLADSLQLPPPNPRGEDVASCYCDVTHPYGHCPLPILSKWSYGDFMQLYCYVSAWQGNIYSLYLCYSIPKSAFLL